MLDGYRHPKYRDPQWRRALDWWVVWREAAKRYAYRYMCVPRKRGSPLTYRYKKRFTRCRERMAAAQARIDARERGLEECQTTLPAK